MDRFRNYKIFFYFIIFFSKTIPSTLSKLRSLFFLDLSNNMLTGPLFNFTKFSSSITIMNLENNKFMGPMPPSIGLCSNLVQLGFGSSFKDGCNISGTLPLSFANLVQLTYLSFGNAGMINVPTTNNIITLFFSSLVNLKQLYLGGTKFRGYIPFSLCKLTKLDIGPIPRYPCCIDKSYLYNSNATCVTEKPTRAPTSLPAVAPLRSSTLVRSSE